MHLDTGPKVVTWSGPLAYDWQIGDETVIIADGSPARAIIVGMEEGRAFMRWGFDGSESGPVRLKTLIPDFRAQARSLHPQPLVVLMESTDSLRRLARTQVTAADSVVEIGCAYGDCTRLLAATDAIAVVGLDTSLECVKVARASLGSRPNVQITKLDVLVEPAALTDLLSQRKPSVLVIDINGDRQAHDLVDLMSTVFTTADLHHPELVLVKSEQLSAMAPRVFGASSSRVEHEQCWAALAEQVFSIRASGNQVVARSPLKYPKRFVGGVQICRSQTFVYYQRRVFPGL